jgi:biopolymer transport protein TolR
MAFNPLDDPTEDQEVMADINVTPLVDVMLVLLIIFMIATPMLHQGVEVNLPEMERAETLPLREQDPVVLTVTKEDVVFIQDDPVHVSRLVDRLLPMLEARGDKTVFLKGDREVAYGSVLRVIDLLEQADIARVALVTEPARLDGRE